MASVSLGLRSKSKIDTRRKSKGKNCMIRSCGMVEISMNVEIARLCKIKGGGKQGFKDCDSHIEFPDSSQTSCWGKHEGFNRPTERSC